jgi:hypothetical protein
MWDRRSDYMAGWRGCLGQDHGNVSLLRRDEAQWQDGDEIGQYGWQPHEAHNGLGVQSWPGDKRWRGMRRTGAREIRICRQIDRS